MHLYQINTLTDQSWLNVWPPIWHITMETIVCGKLQSNQLPSNKESCGISSKGSRTTDKEKATASHSYLHVQPDSWVIGEVHASWLQWKLSWNQYKLCRLLAYNDDGHPTIANGTQQNELYPVGIQQRRTQPQGTFKIQIIAQEILNMARGFIVTTFVAFSLEAFFLYTLENTVIICVGFTA